MGGGLVEERVNTCLEIWVLGVVFVYLQLFLYGEIGGWGEKGGRLNTSV